MARGMWLEHPEAQDRAVLHAKALRDIAKKMPIADDRQSILDAATFLAMISDADHPPRTREEMREGRARAEARRGEEPAKRARLVEAAAALRTRLAAEGGAAE